jgi:hypothetical protein
MTMSLYHVSHVAGGSLLGPSSTTYLCVVAPNAARALDLAVLAMGTEDGDWKVTRNPFGTEAKKEGVQTVVRNPVPLAA